jgi:hypothetical protein
MFEFFDQMPDEVFFSLLVISAAFLFTLMPVGEEE